MLGAFSSRTDRERFPDMATHRCNAHGHAIVLSAFIVLSAVSSERSGVEEVLYASHRLVSCVVPMAHEQTIRLSLLPVRRRNVAGIYD